MKRIAIQKTILYILCAALLTALLPVHGWAAEDTSSGSISGRHPAESVEFDSPAYQQDPEYTALMEQQGQTAAPQANFTYKTMTSSQNLVDIIKDCEGFSATPYWDVSQWTIGYGTFCGSTRDDVPSEYWNGISEEKGEELLMEYLKDTAESEVNAYFRRIGRQPLQQQFDAIVDFTYALGSGWMYEQTMVGTWLTNPTTEIALMRAMGAWCRVDGEVSSPTCNRRMREAVMYLYGLYLLPHGSVKSDLTVVNDGKLPMFSYVIFQGNGTTLINTRTDDVSYYFTDKSYDTLPTPIRSGYTFSGWAKNGGALLLTGQTVKENLRVTAQWVKLPFTDVSSNAWYTPSVAYCYSKGLMAGTSSRIFDPYGQASRAMVVTVLYRMAGSPKVSGSSGLSDVKAGSYYENAVTWAVQKGVVAGYADGTFGPDRPVTRAEMVTFLWRYAKNIRKLNVSASNALGRYVDGGAVPGYARDAFNWALANGLISGTSLSPMTLSPAENASRAMLSRVLMYLANL